jgi:hypothetical protein
MAISDGAPLAARFGVGIGFPIPIAALGSDPVAAPRRRHHKRQPRSLVTSLVDTSHGCMSIDIRAGQTIRHDREFPAEP